MIDIEQTGTIDWFIVEFPGGKVINRIVRVVADDRGKVLKLSTSR